MTSTPEAGRRGANPILGLGIPERPAEALQLVFFKEPTRRGDLVSIGEDSMHRIVVHLDGTVGTVAEEIGDVFDPAPLKTERIKEDADYDRGPQVLRPAPSASGGIGQQLLLRVAWHGR